MRRTVRILSLILVLALTIAMTACGFAAGRVVRCAADQK